MFIVLIKSFRDKPWRSPETYRKIEKNLMQKWDVISINQQDSAGLIRKLIALKTEYGKQLFVFNIAEYINEEEKSGFIPKILEKLKIPHLGSSARAIQIGLEKGKTKQLLVENDIPTPAFVIVNQINPQLFSFAKRVGYPLIVKPVHEGGHIGVTNDSIVHHAQALEETVRRVIHTHAQPAIVERYLTGEAMREFSVGIIDGKERILTPIEIDYDAMDVEKKILSYEAAQQDLERTKDIPGRQDRQLINDLALQTFDVIGAKDYSRVDLRMDHTGCYVLEINVMPGLGPHSFLPEAAREQHGLDYGAFICRLAQASINRQFSAAGNVGKLVAVDT